MFATSGSSALSAWLFLITSATTIYRSAGQPLQSIACSQPDSFTVQITENENVVVYGTELRIEYNPRAGIHPFPGIDAVNVVYNESIIEFNGYMLPEYPRTLTWEPESLSWTSSGIILGTGTLQKLSREDYTIRECRLFLPRNIKSSDNLPYAVRNEIAKYAQDCIEKYLCRRLGRIRAKEQSINKYPRSELTNSASIASYNSLQQNCTLDSIKLNMNDPIDFVIKTAVSYIKNNNKTTVTIPDMNESQQLGLFNVNFQAKNGSFKDLSSLKRTEDAYMSIEGRTHVIKLGFGLGTAKFNFDHYKIKYGIVGLSGKLAGTIDGLALSISLVIDYNKNCPITLQYIKVTEFGDIKIDMTGLGPINGPTSKIISWLTNMWRDKIVNLVEVNAKNIIDEQLNVYACTNYISSKFG